MRFLILLLMLFVTVSSNAQKIVATPDKNADINKLLCTMSDFKIYTFDHIVVRIAICSNESGSAHIEGTDEITNRIYISQCAYDEDPDCALSVIESIFNPSIERVYEGKGSIEIILNYGAYNQKKSATISIPIVKN